MARERAAKAQLESVESEAVPGPEWLVGLVAEGTAEGAPAAAGDQRDHAGLGVAILGRGCAGRDRGLLDGIGADADLRPGRGQTEAAVAGRYRHAVNVGHRLIRPAAADRKRQGAVAVAGHDARLQGEDPVQPVHGQLLDEVTLDPLRRSDFVARDQGITPSHDLDFPQHKRGGFEGEVLGDGLTGEHAQISRLDGTVAYVRCPEVVRARGDVIDEVVAARIGQGAERSPRYVDLGFRNRGTGGVADLAFDPSGRALGVEGPAGEHERAGGAQ